MSQRHIQFLIFLRNLSQLLFISASLVYLLKIEKSIYIFLFSLLFSIPLSALAIRFEKTKKDHSGVVLLVSSIFIFFFLTLSILRVS